ncbi:MAG: HMA2 domain-containing protein [Methylocystis sp.]
MRKILTENSGISEDAPLEAARRASEPMKGAAGKAAASSPSKRKKEKHKHALRVEHQTPGRVRMKIAAAKGNPELLEELGDKFGGIAGVQRCEVNPTTGSVVVYYDTKRHDDFHEDLRRHCEEHHGGPPGTELDEIARKIEDEAEFLAEHSHAARTIVHICKNLDRHVKVATHNTVDLKIGLAGGLVAVTLLEMGAFAATPIWLTLGVFTLNHFVELQQHQVLVDKANAAEKAANSAPRKSGQSD